MTGESRRLRSHRKVIKFGMFHTLVSILAALDFLGTLCTSPLTITLYVKSTHIKVRVVHAVLKLFSEKLMLC